MRTGKFFSLALSATFCLTLAAAAHAATIPVVNGDFEAPAALPFADGTGTFSIGGVIPGWVSSPGAGLYKPNFGTSFMGSNGTNTVAYSNGPTIFQTLGATVQAGTVYTLTLQLGNRSDVAFDGTADLLINGVHYTATGTAPGEGLFSTYTATYTGLAGDVGQAITIELNSSGVQGNYDNVALNAASPTPEPSSIALLGTGLLGMGGALRRRFSKS